MRTLNAAALHWTQLLRFTDLVDIAVVGMLFWALIVWSRRVHANLALVGLAILGGFYLIALQFELQLTAWLFQGFFAVLVIFLVVVFQDDLRRLFEQIAVLGLRRRPARPDPSGSAALFRALVQLGRARTGALLVLPGREPLERHLRGGIALNAEISEELVLSIFDSHSPGHDGAVLVEGNRLIRFGVHLPLSENRAQLGSRGTRHAAALGLAERCDALCVVVSEERGTVSVAQQGQLRVLPAPAQVMEELRRHLELQRGPTAPQRRLFPRLRRHVLEGGLGLALAVAAWLALVPGSTVDQLTVDAPVVVDGLPDGYSLEAIDPEVAEVTVTGPRRLLLLARAADFEVVVDAGMVKAGRRTFTVPREAVRHSTDLEIVAVRPDKVRLEVRKDSER